MQNWFGFLLKYYRLKKNFSQAGICRGICTVSYLSKIENGTAQPSQEIIEQLFAALGIEACWDEEILEDAEKLLQAYFDKLFHIEDVSEESKQLHTILKQFEISPAYISVQLFKIQDAGVQNDIAQMRTLLEQLKPFLDFMKNDERFLYELLLGEALGEEIAYLRADALNPCSYSKYKLASYYYINGQFQRSLQVCAKAYELAANEGNTAMMSEVSFVEGGCYCNLHQFDLLMETYRRCINLNRHNPNIRHAVHYNIGAAYLEIGNYEKALDYLLLIESAQREPFDQFMAYHKLALAYCCLKHKEESLRYLDLAEEILNSGVINDGYEDIYQKMIQVVILLNQGKVDENYLKLLKEVYEESGRRIIFGYQQFHGHMLINAYKSLRRYKEAYLLTEQMNKLINM